MKILIFTLCMPLIFAMSDPKFIPADPPTFETSKNKPQADIKVKPQAQEEREQKKNNKIKTKEKI